METKRCELCKNTARMYCESDQASLCWDCDEKVHAANFLVAKHTRSLLCHVCQCSTPWKASGSKFCPTVSVCHGCVEIYSQHQNGRPQQIPVASDHAYSHEDDDDDDDADFDDEEDEAMDDGFDEGEEDEYDFEDEEDGENQVVPWSCNSSSPPPVASSSSSEEECSSRWIDRDEGKGMRHYGITDSDDEMGCTSSQLNQNAACGNDQGNVYGSFWCTKRPGFPQPEGSIRMGDRGETESRSEAVIDSLRRLQKQTITDAEGASTTVIGICKLSRDRNR